MEFTFMEMNRRYEPVVPIDFDELIKVEEHLKYTNNVDVDGLEPGTDKIWRLTTYKLPGTTLLLCSYGVMMTDPKNRPGHGGEWSSRCEIINQIYGVNLIECVVKPTKERVGLAMAISRTLVELPNDLKWVKRHEHYSEIVAKTYIHK